MSKSNLHTREKILVQALEMFNERGIEYVGLRELAGSLGIRVSNITYYFPTKDNLVYELSQELSKLNSAVLAESGHLTITSFLQMLQQIFQNHIRFRCILLSFVHLMEQNRLISARYKETQELRNATFRANIETLAGSGFLEVKDEGEISFLVSSIALISRFWISEAAISFRNRGPEEQVQHYLSLIARLMLPYATAKARKEIEPFLARL